MRVLRDNGFVAAFAAARAGQRTAARAASFRIAGNALDRAASINGGSARNFFAGGSCRRSAVKSRTMGALKASNPIRRSRKPS
jgi:hypothetical protein